MGFVLFIIIWLTVSLMLYALLWAVCIRRFGRVGMSVFNLGLSVILSPGVGAGAHRAFAFPGGLAVLMTGMSDSSEAFPSLNLMMWMLTFLIFSIVSWYAKKYDTAK
ncbi:hypothetical protein G4G28_14900 [Massilia sp. Dwa41.01b]|uniref:hypothetical protein n=1 Tax=unclassified Massilia TaxID=2609279 RepID=UPI0016037F7B|nr:MULTISPECIES: hypothetical protein [unclassified Massilia]QNA89437.1 hypothetical protein G4G28_14900 [Massilia sp. Dwa41.01b]QNB00339.1 hypothetical protein G4G31_18480 [Massilia sp. Se16.2.3]